jgi:hypothetical protein
VPSLDELLDEKMMLDSPREGVRTDGTRGRRWKEAMRPGSSKSLECLERQWSKSNQEARAVEMEIEDTERLCAKECYTAMHVDPQ